MRRLQLLILCLLFVASTGPAAQQLPENDHRNTKIRHTDLKYTMPEYRRLSAWQRRAEFLQKQILSSAGLLPMPEKTPLRPQVFGKVEHEGYSVEKVILETLPGFYLGGNLYRPRSRSGPYPGILSPHGHWSYGRLEDSERGSVPARGIHLARQGYVVFAYDMIGYNDTVQLPHGFAGPREELWSLGMLGLQLWNSIRAVDFLTSLSDVDPQRIGATGASGGGTQTFMLTAVDDRIRFSAPVNMISGIMQGGSVCENAPNLRIGTNNIEIAALMAPRPMLMVSATGDWTRNTLEEEYPAIRRIYKLFEAEDQLQAVQFDAPHNYNQQSREAVYAFFGKQMFPNRPPEEFKEKAYRVEQLSRMMAFWGRRLPENAKTREQLISYWIDQAEKRTQALLPSDRTSLDRARQRFREGLALSTMAELPAPNELVSDRVDTLPNGEVLVIGRRGKGDRVPAVMLQPRRTNSSIPPTLIVHPEGTAWILSSSESRDGMINQLLRRGGVVAGIDAFQVGRAKQSRDIEDAGRYAEQHYTTFNHTDDANRVQDILTALTYFRTRTNSQEIHLVGMGIGGVWSLFARALADDRVSLSADMAQFDASDDAAYIEKLFIPGLRKNGDFRAASVLLAPGETLLYNLSETFPRTWAEASFRAANAPEQLTLRSDGLDEDELLEVIAPSRRRR